MMHPKAVCEEYLPRFAQLHEVDVTVDDLPDGASLITTVVSYDKLSELSIRLFDLGYILINVDGNVTRIVEDEFGRDKHIEPIVIVSYSQNKFGRQNGNLVSYNN